MIYPTNNSFFEWYTNTFNELDKTPENSPLKIREALLAIIQGEQVRKEGLTENSYKLLQELASRMKEMLPIDKQLAIQELEVKVESLSQVTFQQIEYPHVLMGIAQFNTAEERKNLAFTKKGIRETIQLTPEEQIVSFLKLKQLDPAKPLPSLNFPSDYDLDRLSFEAFASSLPSNLNVEKAFNRLLAHASSIQPGSPHEKVMLYLMKHIPWETEKVSTLPWPAASSIQRIALQANSLLKGEEIKEEDWSFMRYRLGYRGKDPTDNLSLWALLRMTNGIKSEITNKEIVLAAVKQEGRALELADTSLKQDKEVVLAAVKQSREALKHAHETLKNDSEFMQMVNAI